MPPRGRGPDPIPEELEFVFDCFARGLPDSEVKEELQGTEFPLRDPRTIRKYRRHYEAARKVVIAREIALADPVFAEARGRHFRKLTETASKFSDDLERLSEGRRHPVTFDTNVHEKPQVRLKAEFEDLFACLRSHVQSTRLWEAYDNLTLGLVADIERAFSEADEWSFVRDNGDVSCIMIRVPNEYFDVFGRGGSMVFDLPSAFDVAVEEVRSALQRGIVGGHCSLCPSV